MLYCYIYVTVLCELVAFILKKVLKNVYTRMYGPRLSLP